jgi:hypothetical protein
VNLPWRRRQLKPWMPCHKDNVSRPAKLAILRD